MKSIVTGADDGIRLDRWFKRHLPDIAHSMLSKELRKGGVRVDGKKIEASERVVEGQEIRYPDFWSALKTDENHPKKHQKGAKIDPIAIKNLEKSIIFENDDMIVLNKPSGLAVQGGSGQKESVDDILAARARSTGEESPKLVHRLDRDTSGVLVLGKTSKAAGALAAAFAKKTAQKFYWALVVGVPDIEQGTINLPLAKRETGKDSRIEKVQEDEEGKAAITHYRILDFAAKKLAWVELLPVTGRMHQLRVHMESIGHPILGDGKYGGADAFIDGHLASKLHLHARRLELPWQGRTISFEAPLTGHMKESWKLFEFAEPKIRT